MKKSKKIKDDVKSTEVKQNEKAALLTKVYANSVISSANTINQLYNEELDLEFLAKGIEGKVDRLIVGSTKGIESMLMSQALTLDAIFNKMMVKMVHSEFVSNAQVCSDMALKAQNQCRQTLTVLAELKNPKRTTFIKQQNNALNQQVNNNSEMKNLKKFEKSANELLSEEKSHEKLELRKPQEAIAINTQVETLEKVHRPENN